jgi:integrase
VAGCCRNDRPDAPEYAHPVARVVLFCILTGVRKNEALKLTWENVTSQTILFAGDIQKNHKPHHVLRVGLLNSILGDRGEPQDLVFGILNTHSANLSSVLSSALS